MGSIFFPIALLKISKFSLLCSLNTVCLLAIFCLFVCLVLILLGILWVFWNFDLVSDYLGTFSAIIASNIPSLFLLLVSPLCISYAFRICPTILGYSVLFPTPTLSLFCFVLQFWNILLTYLETQWFFPQLFPGYWCTHQRNFSFLLVFLISSIFFWFFFLKEFPFLCLLYHLFLHVVTFSIRALHTLIIVV